MKIELKGLKHFRELSDDSEAFAATILVDGVKAATVRNDGNGGPNEYEVLNKVAFEAFSAEAKRLNPTFKYETGDILVGDLMEKAEDDKFIEKCRKGGFFFVVKTWRWVSDDLDGGEKHYSGASLHGYTNPDQLDGILKKAKAIKHEILLADEAGAAKAAEERAKKREEWKEKTLADLRNRTPEMLAGLLSTYRIKAKGRGKAAAGAKSVLTLIEQVVSEKTPTEAR